MVLLPCARCCGCTCPECVCCTCGAWVDLFNYDKIQNGPAPYEATYYNSLYYHLADILPDCITRRYESQTDCVDALVAQTVSDTGWTEQEVRDAFQEYWEDNDCSNNILTLTNGVVVYGWSAPYLNGSLVTLAGLNSQCPDGPNGDFFCAPGQTGYWQVSEWNSLTGVPDIRHLVLGASTGDWIADALLERGTQEDLPDEGWVEADDCASCASPPVLEFGCTPGDTKVFYDKAVTVEQSFPSGGSDVLGFCPPQNCTLVTITVTRSNACAGGSPVVTTWSAEIAVCPCPMNAFVVSTDGCDIDEVYGYESEQACIDDLTEDNCLGGTPADQCGGTQWQLVRHYTSGGSRACLELACRFNGSGHPECCT